MGKGLSITAFVFSLIFPIVGLILGIIALKKAKDDPEALRGLAIAAIVIGGIFTFIVLALIFIGVLASFGIFVPVTIQSDERNVCVASAPLSCSDVSVSPSLGANNIRLHLLNGLSEDINVSKILIGACVDPDDNLGKGWILEGNSDDYIHTTCKLDLEKLDQLDSTLVIYYTKNNLEFTSNGILKAYF